MEGELEIDWDDAMDARNDGRLEEYLRKLPPVLWGYHDLNGNTFLHYACMVSGNIGAFKMLIKSGIFDIETRDMDGRTCAHYAANLSHEDTKFIYLCKSGCQMRNMDLHGVTPAKLAFDGAFFGNDRNARIVLACGVRASTGEIPEYLEPFQESIVMCKSKVITLLALKRRRIRNMVNLDRFLMRELAVEFWAGKNVF